MGRLTSGRCQQTRPEPVSADRVLWQTGQPLRGIFVQAAGAIITDEFARRFLHP